MKAPLISIIVPVYKVEPYLRPCLDSVVNQTYTNLEIILVDDGSPDNCPQMCEDYAIRDCRIKVIHKENGGLSDARNAGLDIAKGDYIYFLDADDYIGNETIASLYKHIQEKDNTAIAIGYFTADYDGEYKPYRKDWIFNKPRYIEAIDFANRMLMEKSNFAATAKLYKKQLFENLRFKKNKKNEDTLFIADLALVMEKKSFISIDIPLYSYYYRIHAQSISHDEKDPLEKHVINNYGTIIKMFKSRVNIVHFLINRQFDLTIDLQTKYLKSGYSDEYIDNIGNIKKIPLLFIIKKKKIKFILYFIILKYAPRLFLKFKQK